MNTASLLNLVGLTLTNPAEAARRLLAMKLGGDVLWLAFSLAVILNAALQSVANIMLPALSPDTLQVAEPLSRTLVVSVAAILISVASFLLVGRLLGGTANFYEIMTLVIWLQLLQIVGQAFVIICGLALPFLFLPFSLAMLGLSLFITLHFLNQAHKFDSLGRSFVVILISGVVAIPFVLMLFSGGPV
ncbi:MULTISPECIES: Yip1 family protein [unclassified Ruegeria]|uniref:Yip1 family protein n=1 Tax=unclassified Ruegeria TaxID=2625375 RepID=UPI001487C3D1|nr:MULTISPECIES: Yip1 family protein [unclassified Ruegeria]